MNKIEEILNGIFQEAGVDDKCKRLGAVPGHYFVRMDILASVGWGVGKVGDKQSCLKIILAYYSDC